MKKIMLFAVACVALAACCKDEASDESSSEPVAFKKGQKVTLNSSADVDGATDTRVAGEVNGDDIDFKWSADDKLTVTVAGKSSTFTLKSGAGTANAVFEGTMPEAGTNFTASVGSSDIPTTQTYSPASPIPANSMYFKKEGCTVGSDKTADITLEPQSSLMILNLYGDETIGRIEFNDGSNTYTLNTSGVMLTDTKQPFYIVVPSGTYQFTAKVYDTAGTNVLRTLSPSAAQTFTAGLCLSMPARYISGCLYFEAEEDGVQVSLKNVSSSATVSLKYLIEGADWEVVTVGDDPFTTLTKRERVYVKADGQNDKFGSDKDTYNYHCFSATGKLKAGGNIMYLLNGTSPATTMTADNAYCFKNLFREMPITDISELILPATTLANNCYQNMFLRCNYLTDVPKDLLPATTLADNCYNGMFYLCDKLTGLPDLPATTLAVGCYRDMFHSCKSLTEIPTGYLKAAALKESCYYGMFQDCEELTTIPEDLLPAETMSKNSYNRMFCSCYAIVTVPTDLFKNVKTLAISCFNSMFSTCKKLTGAPKLPNKDVQLANQCYQSMFSYCESLETAPVLPAETLVQACYYSMFKNCTKLKYVEVNFTDWGYVDSSIPSFWSTGMWLDQVSSAGTFKCPSGLSTTTRGGSKVPSGWTVTH